MDAAPPSRSAMRANHRALPRGPHANVAYSSKEPVTFRRPGVKVMVPNSSKFERVLLLRWRGAGGTGAQFTIGHRYRHNSLSQFGIVVGAISAGSSTKPCLKCVRASSYITDRLYFAAEFR